MKLINLLLLLFCMGQDVLGKNILFFHSLGTLSHRNTIWPLAERLADEGHDVTYIFPLKNRKGSHPKIEEILPSKMVPILTDWLGDFDINIRLNNTILQWLSQVFSITLDLCEAFYTSPEVEEWLSRKDLHYDLVFIDTSLGDCIYPVVHQLKAKHILFAPVFSPALYDGFGIVPESASFPGAMGFLSKPKSEMDFLTKVEYTLAPLIWRAGYVDYIGKLERMFREKLEITDMPSVDEMAQKASLLMINHHFIEDYPMSLPPLVVSISGLWCRNGKGSTKKPIPKKISKFIEKGDGFIYVSLGSAVVATKMPKEMRDQFLEAFGAFPHLKFLFRWTGPVPENAPKNVLFDKWFPQSDLLAHPKIKGFISQAGRPSSQEALCTGVPLITIPIFGDQDYNAARLEYIGASIDLDIGNFSAKVLQDSIKELTETDKYYKRMQELSSMFKDRPMDPLDSAIYWTKYALRYNTTLLRPLGINKTWWQRRLLDVWAFIFLVVLVLLGTILFFGYLVLKYVLRKLLASSKHKTE